MKKLIKKFAKAQNGNVAIIVALSGFALTSVTFGAIDYSRAIRLKTQLQSIADSVALATAQQAGDHSTNAIASAIANAQLELHRQELTADISKPAWDYKAGAATTPGQFTAILTASIPSTIPGIFENNQLKASVQSTAQYGAQVLESTTVQALAAKGGFYKSLTLYATTTTDSTPKALGVWRFFPNNGGGMLPTKVNGGYGVRGGISGPIDPVSIPKDWKSLWFSFQVGVGPYWTGTCPPGFYGATVSNATVKWNPVGPVGVNIDPSLKAYPSYYMSSFNNLSKNVLIDYTQEYQGPQCLKGATNPASYFEISTLDGSVKTTNPTAMKIDSITHTTDRFIVDGVRMKNNTAIKPSELFPCGKTVTLAFEDGGDDTKSAGGSGAPTTALTPSAIQGSGDWEYQDFFLKINTVCTDAPYGAPNSQNTKLRLVK